MAVLIGMAGDIKGKQFPLGNDELTIGRSKDNAIVLDNPTVSGHHCKIVSREGRYVLMDLESTNGTRLNAKEVTEAKLRPKDLVQAGSVEFLFDGEATEGEEPKKDISESMSDTEVEEAAGPVSAPDSFASISPFGTRRNENRGLWVLAISVVGIAALALVVYVFVKLLTVNGN
jgi:pSer/pThr/pTyr-binding forkhead associated (FHA) protein